MVWLFAQFADTQLGEELLENSAFLVQKTVESWDEVWEEVVSPQSPLWLGLCRFGLLLAALSLLLVTLKIGFDYQQGKFSWSDLAGSFLWPLIIVWFLTGSGAFLAQNVLFLRSLAYGQIQAILSYQVADITFKQALADITLTQAARNAINAIAAECQGKPPDQLADCLVEKQSEVEAIIDQAEELNGTPLAALEDLKDELMGFVENPLAAFTASVATILIAILQGLQWAFVNILEASLLMTAVLAPVAMGLSLLPLGSRTIWAWGSGYLGLFAIQFGYILIVGLAAAVIVKAGAQGLSDLAFLSFISIFAPGLAVMLGGGGGVAMYVGMNRHATELVGAAVNLAKMAVMAF